MLRWFTTMVVAVLMGLYNEFTNFGATSTLDWATNNGTPTRPTNLYVQLHTGAPGADATANVSTETTRVAAPFGPATNGSCVTTGVVAWPSIGVSAQELITHSSLHDASTAGNAWYQGAVDTSKTVDPGDNVEYASGALGIDHVVTP